MLQKQAYNRNACPTAKTESQRLAACCNELDDICIQAYRSHRHNDKELTKPFERCKNLCCYAHACRQRSDKFCLTIDEASEYFNIGEKKLRQIASENLGVLSLKGSSCE